MSNKFLADPVILRSEGNKQLDQKGLFVSNTQKIYSTLNEMMSSDYLAPAARQMAEAIRAKKELLDSMANIIGDYGTFCLTSGKNVTDNDQNITDNYVNKI